MNNNFFAVARFLRDRGIDAHLLLFENETSHFHPAHDTFELSYQNFTRQLRWGSSYLGVLASTIARDLRDFDFLIGCGPAPAFVHKAGRVLDLFIPYGSDIMQLPFLRLVDPRRQLDYAALSLAQRRGIRGAPVLSFDTTNDTVERYVERLNYPGRRLHMGIPMLYTPEYAPQKIEHFFDRTHWYHEFKAVREAYELLIFHHARQFWAAGPDKLGQYKGNDKVVRGLADFVRMRPEVSTCLIALEYGPDVAATKRLASELGLERNIRWFPQMSRKDLMVGLSLADIGCGEFGRSSLSCGTVYETLAMAKPLMHYRNDELYVNHYPELYPLLNVRSAEDVAAALVAFVNDRSKYTEIGRQGRQWLERYAIEAPIDEYVRLIAEKSAPGEPEDSTVLREPSAEASRASRVQAD